MVRHQNIPTKVQNFLTDDINGNFDDLAIENQMMDHQSLDLIRRLCLMLDEENISYCHWKSNNALDRSATGENDLDLLVARGDVQRFTEILFRLNFKQAVASPLKRMPGVLDYFGYDSGTDNFVHVHAHFQLIVGHDMTKNIHLPVERPYLASSHQGDLFKYADPSFEYIVFVIRMILKHSTWDAVLGREGNLNKAERQELAHLQSSADQNRVQEILNQHLRFIGLDIFVDCVAALSPDISAWTRIKTGHNLLSKLQSHARRPILVDTFLKNWRRGKLAFQRRIYNYKPKYRLESGGAMIAIVGGDGAGKTTAIDGLSDWLEKKFELTNLHMGKPPWSLTTITVRSLLKIGNLLGLYPDETTYRETFDQKSILSPAYPWLMREVCRARDRFWTFVKARRFATNGGLVILDRFPLPQIKLMDGPLATQFMDQLMQGNQTSKLLKPRQSSRAVKWLTELEKSYYQKMSSPEIVFVLRVQPETAVQRKIGEDLIAVRERSKEIWEQNWDDTGTHLIEADKPKDDVLAELKRLIWSEL